MEEGHTSQCQAVASYLQALVHFLALTPLGVSTATSRVQIVLRQLQNASLQWNASKTEEISAELSASSCEAIVSVLRLLYEANCTELDATRCASHICAFLALASTVRAFEEARDVPGPGQAVTIFGLQSSQHLNGCHGCIKRFHAESGRFIVQLSASDPPSDWKKVRLLNLKFQVDPASARAMALEGARECGRGCLESIAEIFDDIITELHAVSEGLDAHPCNMLLQSQLAVAMWEALVSCCGDGGAQLQGSVLLDLCGGDVTLVSVFAQNILSAHAAHNIVSPREDVTIASLKIQGLQSSFARSYCSLYQASSLWGNEDGSYALNDINIADLQVSLDRHVQRLSSSASNMALFESFADAAYFHVSQAKFAGSNCPLPFALPVLLFRLICTVLSSAFANADSTIQRHVLLLGPYLMSVVRMFCELVTDRLNTQSVDVGDLLLTSQVALDVLVVFSGLGLFDAIDQASVFAAAVGVSFLCCEKSASDAPLLARLALAFANTQFSEIHSLLQEAYTSLDLSSKSLFWQQVRARSKLRNFTQEDAVNIISQFIGDTPVPASSLDQTEERCTEHQLQALIDSCVQSLPESLRDAPPTPATDTTSLPRDSTADAAIAGITALASGVDLFTERPEGTDSLGALNLPPLPGHSRRATEGVSAASRRRLLRSDFQRIRGVDPSAAPAELCCAIDGKLMGTPIRSPFGHVFEEDTLQQWLGSCGSVCPITGQLLRREDCEPDLEIQNKVSAWVKSARALHKQNAAKRRARRTAAASSSVEEVVQ